MKRSIAKYIYYYHKEHGLPQDKTRDWVWAEELWRNHGESLKQAMIWDKRKKLRGGKKINLKEFVGRWLDWNKYGYSDQHKTEPKWRLIWRKCLLYIRRLENYKSTGTVFMSLVFFLLLLACYLYAWALWH